MRPAFKVGDWVTWNGQVAYKTLAVVESSPGGHLELAHYGRAEITKSTRVLPMKKPPRKLTLSAGLAWMRKYNRTSGTGAHLILSPQLVDDDSADMFAVIDQTDEDCEGVWYGPTPCKAIIAARKSLGVK